MMAEGDLGRPELGGGTIEDAATQARAQRAGGFSFRDLLFDDAVGVLFDNLVFNPSCSRYAGRICSGNPGCF